MLGENEMLHNMEMNSSNILHMVSPEGKNVKITRLHIACRSEKKILHIAQLALKFYK